MAVISLGAGPAIRTQSSFPSSCSSKHGSPPSSRIITIGSAHFPISPHWRALRKMRCFARGKAWAITLARETCMPPREPCWRTIADVSRCQSTGCGSSQGLGSTLRTLLPASRSIDLSQLSKRTPLEFWQEYSILASLSIRPRDEKLFGNVQRIFVQCLGAGHSTPHFSILARSFA